MGFESLQAHRSEAAGQFADLRLLFFLQRLAGELRILCSKEWVAAVVSLEGARSKGPLSNLRNPRRRRPESGGKAHGGRGGGLLRATGPRMDPAKAKGQYQAGGAKGRPADFDLLKAST
ncbi:hypothetical protein GCM10027020_32280 [Nocardioides salsibiostraticola]